MSQPKVYLAGPVTGMTMGEANDWRTNFIGDLSNLGFIGVSPLRCEPIRGPVYSPSYEDPLFGTPRAIASKNYLDVQRCDLTLCYFPKGPTEEKGVSLGTVIELAWAFSLRKPTILVSDASIILEHPVVQANASWIVETLDDSLEIIKGVFSIYMEEANSGKGTTYFDYGAVSGSSPVGPF